MPPSIILANINDLPKGETQTEALKKHLEGLNIFDRKAKDTGKTYTQEELAERRNDRIKRGER